MNNLPEPIAVIGERTIAQVFTALGYACFYDTERDAIIARCDQLAAEGCRIILILEHAATQIADYLDEHASDEYPIMLPIPDTLSGNHYGMSRLQANLAKAIGRQIGGNL